MSPTRAQGIITAARFVSTYGPWSDMIDKVMAPGEREQVIAVWELMPNHTCFVDALNLIASNGASRHLPLSCTKVQALLTSWEPITLDDRNDPPTL